MLFCRGLQSPDYTPTCLDVAAAALKLFDDPPVRVTQLKLQ